MLPNHHLKLSGIFRKKYIITFTAALVNIKVTEVTQDHGNYIAKVHWSRAYLDIKKGKKCVIFGSLWLLHQCLELLFLDSHSSYMHDASNVKFIFLICIYVKFPRKNAFYIFQVGAFAKIWQIFLLLSWKAT